MPAISSMATSRLTIACFVARSSAPTAIVTDGPVGIATGIAATVSTNANCKSGRHLVAAEKRDSKDRSAALWRSRFGEITDFVPNTAPWKWLTVCASCTSCAVLPK